MPMITSMKKFETNALDLRHLDAEHAEICRRYEGLDGLILRQGSMHGISRILAAAGTLLHLMLLHFTHEEQLLVVFSSDGLLQRHRETSMKIATRLFDIKAELEQGKVAPVFRLLRLTKVWMNEHMNLENLEYAGLIEEDAFWACPAAVDQRNERQACGLSS
jgi:hemerythrin